MPTSQFDFYSAGGIYLSPAYYTNPLTITNTGTINEQYGGNGILATQDWTIQNAGVVYGSNDGIRLQSTGSIGNTGTITGGAFGIFFTSYEGRVDNSGVIQGTGPDGVAFGAALYGGGDFINEAGGTVSYDGFGVVVRGTYGTIDNSGLIYGHIQAIYMGATNSLLIDHPGAVFQGAVVASGTSTSTIELAAGAHVGTLTGVGSQFTGFGTIAVDSGATWYIAPISSSETVKNAGTIGHGSTYGLELTAGGSVTNLSGGTIVGIYAGVLLRNVAGTVDNSGVIAADHYSAVFLGAGGTVINRTGGTIYGHKGVSMYGAADTLENAGLIYGSGGSNAIAAYLAGTTSNRLIIDAGASFHGTVVAKSGAANTLELKAATGALTTMDTEYIGFGTIAIDSGASWYIAPLSTPETIVNAGTLGMGARYGIELDAGGAVTNREGGTIGGTTGGVFAGVLVRNAAGAVDNGGLIATEHYSSVFLGAGGSVINEDIGTIVGQIGVSIYGGTGTLENQGGTIIGSSGTAVYFHGTVSNRLILEPGGTFIGIVEAGNPTAANTIELRYSGTVGTLSGVGSEYVGFQSVTIDSGAAWDVAGTKAGLAAETIQGFNSHDRLDLTDLTFNAGDTATVNGSNQLVITDAGGNITIQLDGAVTGDLFKLVSDGHGGTFAEENDYAACYLRGTLILTAKGEVVVEDLRIGDLVITAGGEALPLKWIGRRSYRDWLAGGNQDVQPVLFKAGSLADHVPRRDLYVSPEHAMFLNGALIPARHLVNGVSILNVEDMAEVEYFHLEFDRHAVILAEGAQAESFVDDDSRMLFHNADEYRRLYPDEPPRRAAVFCAPRLERGHALDTIRRTLAARAGRLSPGGSAAASPEWGYLDFATRSRLEGWAFAGEGREPVALAVVVNGAVVGRTVAGRYRADLAAAGIGDGRCGFRFDLPRGLSPTVSHCVEVRRESDWTLLRGAPVLLEPFLMTEAIPV